MLSAWRVASCGHMQQQLVMLLPYRLSACCLTTARRYSLCGCPLCNHAPSYALSAWHVALCGQVQQQLVMLSRNDTASHECRCNSTTKQHDTVCSSITACAYRYTGHDVASAGPYIRGSGRAICAAPLRPAMCCLHGAWRHAGICRGEHSFRNHGPAVPTISRTAAMTVNLRPRPWRFY